MKMDCEQTFRLNEGILSVPLEGEHVVLGMDSEKYFGVRGAVRHLLEGLREGMTMTAMIEDTCSRYVVEAEVARRDLHAVISQLVTAGILIRER